MKINIKFIALLAIICLLSLSAVSADGDNQTDTGDLPATDDADNGVVNDDDAGQTTDEGESNTQKTLDDVLKKNIINADSVEDGARIVLDKDYDLDATICIDSKITLDGQGHTLNGKNTVRAIAARTTDVTLQNIIFENGQSDSGAGVWAKEGSITLINCTFINNKATGYGGAFYSLQSGNTIINCIFENNVAAQSGGAVNIDKNGNTLINNTFKNNVATSKNGGAITITGKNTAGKNIIKGNTFENNKATKGDAGALYLDKTNGDEISDDVFIKNSAMRGGAVSLYEAGYSTITNNTFTSNNATVLGGAIRESISNSKTKTTISNNKFIRNSAPTSGAIHIDGNNITISENMFDNNKATQDFGGSIGATSNTISILNNNITNTNAKTLGGAIYVKGNPITIKSNEISNANAVDGGAVYVDKTSVATIDSNSFTKCTATNFGGAIRAECKVIITKNTFKDNSASKGSDIRIYNGDGSQVKNNDFATYTASSLVTYGNVAIQDNKGFKDTLKIETLNKNYAVTTTAKYLTVVLKNSKGTGVSGKTLTISLNGKTYTGTTDANGKYKTKIAISAIKKYTCTVKFAGDDTNFAATNSFYLYVTKASTKISSPAKTFKKSAVKKVVVTLKSGKKVLAKKKVSIKINGKTYKGTTNSRGKATIKIKITKKGSFKGTLKYTGNKTYKACTGKVTVKIK